MKDVIIHMAISVNHKTSDYANEDLLKVETLRKLVGEPSLEEVTTLFYAELNSVGKNITSDLTKLAELE